MTRHVTTTKTTNLQQQIRRNPKMALRRDGRELIVLPPMVRKRMSAYRP